MVKRLFVEKKKGFDVEAQGLFSDIKQSLDISKLSGIRVFNRYDIAGVDADTFEASKFKVFAEAPIDSIYEKELPEHISCMPHFAVEYLPGQYDQRADSASVCIKLLRPEADPQVRFARVIVLEGDVSEDDIKKIKTYVVNPVDSRIADEDLADTLEFETEVPSKVSIIEGFTAMTDEELESMMDDMGLAMSFEDMKHIHQYFKNEEKRNPSLTEILVIDTYWSDHCRHTTFNTVITNTEFAKDDYGDIVKAAFDKYMEMRAEVYEGMEKPVTLMDMAVIGAKYLKKNGKATKIDESEEINACSIKVTAEVDGKKEDWLVMFKNETHNHPTEIEPFGGAATCLGGAIRDPLSGRVYVYQAMRVTGSADPRTPIEDTLEGKLPQRKITKEAAHGYSSYGNQIGLATGQVAEIYHPNFVAKRMEVGAVVGAAPAKNVKRAVPMPGDVILLVGGMTGRDGCGGATGSSKEHDVDSIITCGAEVQKGNPPVERNIQRLFRREEVATLIKRCNDFGAGGVSVAIGELADGLDIDLDKVTKKYEGLDGTELAISESQERMAVVVEAKDMATFIELAASENLNATKVAEVTDTNRVKMYWRGDKILDLSRDFLNTNGAIQETAIKVSKEESFDESCCHNIVSMDDLKKFLSDINCVSQKGLVERFDSTIGKGTLLMPLGGKYQLTPSVGMAAKLPITGGDTNTATLMSYGFDPYLASSSPFHGALYAVVDSLAKLTAMGGNFEEAYLSFQEYFEKLSSEKSWGKPMAALLGALTAQREMGVAAIGGKDSMSGTFMDINVPPSLLSFAITPARADKVISSEIKKAGSRLALVKIARDEDNIINFEALKAGLNLVYNFVQDNKILSANTVGFGGAFMTLVKMALGNKIGLKVSGLSPEEWGDKAYGNLIIELPDDEKLNEIKKAASDVDGLDIIYLGKTNPHGKIKIGDENAGNWLEMKFHEILEPWEAGLEEIFPTKTLDNDKSAVEKIIYSERSDLKPSVKLEPDEKPYVVIPTFPGTNCEMDSARTFAAAGADPHIFIIRNRTTKELEQSLEELAKEIDKAHIIMLPGGFSGGDEPDGSAKFITAIFRNEKIKAATMRLLDERKGLMLGICNGFQALIKLGLVPYGKIVDQEENFPTLTYNKIGRHVSTMVRTSVSSVKSPWFAGVEAGDVFTIPVSHGEGRFICNEDVLAELKANGQIAAQYVNDAGMSSMNISINPNASVMSIEAITSPDGRILGKMGHSERIGENLYKNIAGEKDMKLFESAVAYFKK